MSMAKRFSNLFHGLLHNEAKWLLPSGRGVQRKIYQDRWIKPKDLYGFVYAPERNSRGLYDPFPNASVYHR
jgi:hypothetical protein